VISPKSVVHVTRDMVIVPTAHFAWATGYSLLSRKIAAPVILAGIAIAEKFEPEN
jgi:hypothetical protein